MQYVLLESAGGACEPQIHGIGEAEQRSMKSG